MKKYLGFVAVSLFLLSCTNTDRDNPNDMWGSNYMGNASAEGSSSSVEMGDEPSSSSVVYSGGLVEPSSSSVPPSSSSGAESSSSIAPSSNSVEPSSSSAPPSSSSTAPSSSSVVLSSSSARPSSSSVAPSSSSNAVSNSSSSVPSSSSSVGFSGSYGSVDYNGQTYKTVRIGEQVWFAENLNYAVSGSKCYEGLDSNCNTYGRLYDWATARTVCPSGWHLPTQAEWNTLSSYVQSTSGCSSCDARLLKKTSGWDSYTTSNGVASGNGTDDYGFSALPGGNGISDGSFDYVGSYGRWWSANATYYYVYTWVMYSNGSTGWASSGESFLHSVRCLQY